MKPGDTVRILRDYNNVILRDRIGPMAIRVDDVGQDDAEVARMLPHEVGMVLAVAEFKGNGCKWDECLVLVSKPDGGAAWGWRETSMFEVV